MRLADKVALVTGGAAGIGCATAEVFLAEGASVVVADIREPDPGSGEHDRLRYTRCDVRSEDDTAAAVGVAVREFGRLDVAVHCAGAVGDQAGVGEIGIEGWDATQALLLRSSMLLVKHASGAMKDGGGSIILMSSGAALSLGGAGPYAYTVAKAGVIALARFAALELAADSIRVNTLIPGAIPTGIWGGVDGLQDEGARSDFLSRFATMQPLLRPGDVRDLAEAATWLASDASGFVTGTVLPVDGGLSLFRPTARRRDR